MYMFIFKLVRNRAALCSVPVRCKRNKTCTRRCVRHASFLCKWAYTSFL